MRVHEKQSLTVTYVVYICGVWQVVRETVPTTACVLSDTFAENTGRGSVRIYYGRPME